MTPPPLNGGGNPQFLHATPTHRWTAADKQNVEPYRGASDIECSRYFYWWLYAQMTQYWYEYDGKHSPTASAFIEAWDANNEIDIKRFYGHTIIGRMFMSWWECKGLSLFSEPPARSVRMLDPGSLVPEHLNDISVAIPVQMPASSALPHIKHLIHTKSHLQTQGVGRIRSAAIQFSQAQFRFEKTMSVLTLYRYAETFFLVQYLKTLAPKSFRMGHALAFSREKRGSQPLPIIPEDVAHLSASDVGQFTKEASRRYTSALRLIDGVRLGRFPYYSNIAKAPPESDGEFLGYMMPGAERYRPSASVEKFAAQLQRFKPYAGDIPDADLDPERRPDEE
jgi:hypothetical protein